MPVVATTDMPLIGEEVVEAHHGNFTQDGTLFLALNRGPGKDTRGREVAFFDAVTQQLVHRLTTATASATPTTPRTEITRWSRTTATTSSP